VGPDVFLSGAGGVLLSGFAAARRKAQSFSFAAAKQRIQSFCIAAPIFPEYDSTY